MQRGDGHTAGDAGEERFVGEPLRRRSPRNAAAVPPGSRRLCVGPESPGPWSQPGGEPRWRRWGQQPQLSHGPGLSVTGRLCCSEFRLLVTGTEWAHACVCARVRVCTRVHASTPHNSPTGAGGAPLLPPTSGSPRSALPTPGSAASPNLE